MIARGLLDPEGGKKKFQLTLHKPAQDLAFFVEYHWLVSWDLRGQEPYTSENLPHPCVHLVIERGQPRIYGVVRGKFSYFLEGQGQALGTRFRPGAFYPFIQVPISTLTDRSFDLWKIFGIEHEERKTLEAQLFACANEPARQITFVEDFLRARLPERDEQVESVQHIVERIVSEREITRVDELVQRLALSKRTLQRLFSQYVGVSPKWVIQRNRLHEAAEQLARGKPVDWSQLAQNLGYFDQAHFIKDFKVIIGKAPAEYTKSLE